MAQSKSMELQKLKLNTLRANVKNMKVKTMADLKNLPSQLMTFGQKKSAFQDMEDLAPEIQGNSPEERFLRAAQRGNLDDVKKLSSTVDVNVGDVDSYSALNHAAARGHTEVVAFLLSLKAIQVNKKSKDGYSALNWASFHGRTEVVRLLLANPEIEINSVGKRQVTSLAWASLRGHAAVVRLLLAHPGIDVNLKGKDDITALGWAAQYGHTEVVSQLLEVEGINVNEEESNNPSPLALAAKGGHVEAVKYFLIHPSTTVTSTNKKKPSALICAAKGGFTEVVTLLLLLNPSYNMEEIGHVIRNTPQALATLLDSCMETDRGRSPESSDYYVLYNFKAAGLCGEKAQIGSILHCMIQSKRISLLGHPMISMIFALKWRVIQFFYYVDLLSYALVVGLLSSLITTIKDGFEPSPALGPILLIAATTRLFFQFIQSIKHPILFFQDWKNIIDLGVTACAYVVVIMSEEADNDLMSITILFAWLNLFVYLRHVEVFDIGLYVLMFLQVGKTFFIVLALFSVLLLAFGFGLYALAKGVVGTETVGFALNTELMTIFGDLSFYSEVFGYTTSYGKAMVIFFLFVLPLLSVNFLIGLAVGDIASIRDSAELTKLELVSFTIIHFDAFSWIRKAFWSFYRHPVLYPNKPFTKSRVIGKVGSLTSPQASLLNFGFGRVAKVVAEMEKIEEELEPPTLEEKEAENSTPPAAVAAATDPEILKEISELKGQIGELKELILSLQSGGSSS